MSKLLSITDLYIRAISESVEETSDDDHINEIEDIEEVNKEEIQDFTLEASTPERTSSGKLIYRDETFPGYNKPKRYKGPKKYKFRVLAKEGDEIKIINFGHTDYEDFTQHHDSKRRKNFRARMQCDPVKNLKKTTARYWACQYLW